MTSRGFLQKHNSLARRLDEWFRSLLVRHAAWMQCRRGCARCCYGLFDIGLPDAYRVAKAFGALPEEIRSEIADRASVIQEKIRQEGSELQNPFFLNTISQNRIDQLVERIQEVRCPFLGERDDCLIYEDKPLACRLEGIPMVDSNDGLFGDWCELNFKEGISPGMTQDLRLDYYDIEAVEREVTEYLSECMLGNRQAEVTVFLPSIIAFFDSYWRFHSIG